MLPVASISARWSRSDCFFGLLASSLLVSATRPLFFSAFCCMPAACCAWNFIARRCLIGMYTSPSSSSRASMVATSGRAGEAGTLSHARKASTVRGALDSRNDEGGIRFWYFAYNTRSSYTIGTWRTVTLNAP
jgi:hypothetical protein